MCYRHIKATSSLSKIVLAIINNMVDDSVLINLTYSGESKLDKTHKLIDFKNVCTAIYASFVFAGTVNKYEVPTLKDVNKALSAAVRHASERLDRVERNRYKELTRKEKTDALPK